MSRFGRLGPVMLSTAAIFGLAACTETAPRNDVVWGRPAPVYVQPPPSYGYHGRPEWVRNGVCEDDRYQTSNKGGAPAGQDEYDCLLFGNGLKAGRVKNEGDFARNGVCDDPNYLVSTGRARRGTDDYDCSRFGQGVRGVHQRGGLPAYLPSTDQPRPRPEQAAPAAEPDRPEILGRGAIRRADEGDAMRQTQMEAEVAAQRQAERQAMAEEAAQREAAQREAAQREAAQREAAQREAAQREADESQRRAEEEQRRMQEEMERQRQQQAQPEPEREGQRVVGRGLIERTP